MPRLSTPVAIAAGQTRQRAAHARAVSRRHPAPRRETLSPNELGLGKLFVHSRDGLIVGNVETGLIALWNPAAERLFGWSAAEAVGQPIEMLIPPAIIRLHQASMALYRRTGRGNVLDSGAPLEVPALTKAGNEIHVEVSLVALDHPSGTRSYVLAMLRDASDRRRADLQHLEATRADSARSDAQHALQRHHQLVHDGATDLDRELVHLERSAQRLRQEVARAQDEARPSCSARRARIVEARTARVRHILDQLATLAAANAQTLELRPERSNLVPLVGRVVAQMRARGTPCKLNVALPQGLTALVDPFRIEQVLRTLLEGAMRRNPRGCWVDLDLRRPLAGQARIEIRDIGRPVTAAVRQRLQDVSSADRGLALSRLLVEQHGGTLNVEFPADGGVWVIVTLPTQRGRVPSDAV
jgi:PAS domain S-box-containing protein